MINKIQKLTESHQLEEEVVEKLEMIDSKATEIMSFTTLFNAETGQEDVLTNVNVDGKIVLAYNLDAFYGDE